MDGSLPGIRENGLLKAVCKQNALSGEKHSKSKSPGSAKKPNGDASPRKQKQLSPTNLSKKFSESPRKKGVKRSRDELSDADSDMPLAELQNCVSDDDDDIVLAKLNIAAKKLKKSQSQTKGLENRGTKIKSTIKQNGTVSSSTLTDDDDDDVSLAVIKQKKADAKQQNKSLKGTASAASPKKKVRAYIFYEVARH